MWLQHLAIGRTGFWLNHTWVLTHAQKGMSEQSQNRRLYALPSQEEEVVCVRACFCLKCRFVLGGHLEEVHCGIVRLPHVCLLLECLRD